MILCLHLELEKFSITSLAHQWILCSEWVPSECFNFELLLLDKSWKSIIHNSTSSSEKVHSMLSSHIKINKHTYLELFSSVFTYNPNPGNVGTFGNTLE